MNLFYFLNNVNLDNFGTADGFCAQTAVIWQLVGRIMMVLRIVFPVLVIVFGIIDVGKSVTAAKPEDVKKSFISLAWRLGAALAIFFIPTIVSFGIRLANGFSDVNDDYKVCADCISNPGASTCDTSKSI